jgi:hypothetical protein
MALPNNLGRLAAGLTADASLNIGVGVTPSGTFRFEVGTTSKFTGVATFGSTLSNGTYTYTLPSATGTLALTSDLSGYLPLTGGTLTGALGGTSASFSSTLLATGTGSNTILGGTGLKVTSSNTGLYLNFSPSFTGGLEAEIASSENGLRIVAAGSGVNTMRFLTSNSSGVSTLALSINGTQAATFSSSLALNSASGTSPGFLLYNYSTVNTGSRSWKVSNDQELWGDYAIQQSTTQTGSTFATKFLINASGNIGIGTTSPATYLHVQGDNTSNRGQLSIQSSNASNAARATWYYSTTKQGEIGTTGGDFYALADNNFLFYAGGSPRMTLTSSGNLGIATQSPSQPLTVAGGELLTAGNSSWFRKTFEINVTTWSSVVTFAPQSNPQYVYGFINITAGAYVNGGAGNGVVTSRWYYSISNNIINVGVVGSDVTSGSPPSVRLIVSSNTIVVQVQSYATGNISFTSVFVDAMLGSGYVNGTYWVIT